MDALILRPITGPVSVERMPPDDEEITEPEPEPAPEPKLARRGLFRVNYGKQLEKALSELRRIEHRRQQLIALDQAENQIASALLTEYQSRVPSLPDKDGDLDEFKKSYRAYLVAVVETTPKITWLQQHIGGLMRLSSINRGGDILKLKSEFPGLKQTICDAVCARAGVMNADAEQVAKREQERLDREHGAGEYDAGDSMPVKRVKANAEYLDNLIKRVQVEPVEATYLDVVRYLLS
jgi:hypothetical protein